MKRSMATSMVVLALGLAWAGPGLAQELDLGAAGRYAGFFYGDASGLKKVEGRLAVGRNLDAAQLEVGRNLPASDDAGPSLVVRRNVTAYTAGDIWSSSGRKGYGTVGAGIKSASASLDLRQDAAVLDFPAEIAWLDMLSASLKGRAATGKTIQSTSTITLTGSGAAMEVFNLQAMQVASGKTLVLSNIKPGAWLVLNVGGDAQRQVVIGWNHAPLQAIQARVLYNLYDTDVLTLPGGTVWGTLLAPQACVKGNAGRVEGSVFAASWIGPAEIAQAPFTPGP
ncbi:choice-of-anchor A family protein [Pseudoduganella violaceinigra]|uniref:choice-of-anchor A family protein n=1 Tax=Pseudoduganella violaceinigra TaxID=246602 RepID=UPI0003F5580E|nr:choice-of-anchor A family protein [Pseudoduganella violaceinigra]